MDSDISTAVEGQPSPNAGSSDPNDGRKQNDWESRYPPKVSKEIFWEAAFLFFVLFLSFYLIYATWTGDIFELLVSKHHPNLSASRFKEFSYYAFSGLLGGNIFGMKYFYRVVARGFWHQDRRFWRFMSPFISTTVSVIVGALIEANLVPAHKPASGASCLSIGFLAGYFADEAVGKMYEIASVVFGRNSLATSESKQKSESREAGDETKEAK